MKYYIGIDLGGTNIVAGVVDENYKIISKASTKTNLPRPEKEIAADMARVSVQAVKEAGLDMNQIEWVGIGTPGIANSEKGIIEYSCNLGFDNTPMVDYIKEYIDKPVFIENDANAAAYGEYVAGAAKGAKNAVCITLGTGVGGGIIADGRILSGATGAAGEIGHIHVMDGETERCNCGNYGCLEQYTSATGIVRLAKRRLAKDDKPSTLRNHQEISAKTVFDAVKEGDELAVEVAEQFGEILGKALADIAGVVNPEIFVIGGGVSKAGPILLDFIQKNYTPYVFAGSRGALFALATLGNDAGIYGAAKMVLD